MAVWTVFQPDEGKAARPGGHWADGVVFVREAIAWSALVVAPLLLLAHRLWLALFVYLAAQVLILIAIATLDLGDAEMLLLVLPNLLVAFELSALRRRKLLARGREEIGVVVAPNREAAERRFFEGWLDDQSRLDAIAPPASPPDAPPGLLARPLANPVLGLFPEAAGR